MVLAVPPGLHLDCGRWPYGQPMGARWCRYGTQGGTRGTFWILHIGIFIVWLPAVLTAQRTVGNMNRSDFWKIVLKGSPDWMRYMVYGFMGYAVVNFLLFMTTRACWKRRAESAGPGSLARILRALDGFLFCGTPLFCIRRHMECMVTFAAPTVIRLPLTHATAARCGQLVTGGWQR